VEGIAYPHDLLTAGGRIYGLGDRHTSSCL